MPTDKQARGKARWSQQRRLEFIDFRLCWDGRLNRSDLTDFFDISVPQASLDISRYTELAPNNLGYDRSARIYTSSHRFRALYPTSAPDQFLNELLLSATGARDADSGLLGFQPPTAIVPNPNRTIDVSVLIALQRAMRDGTGLRVVYQSLSRPEPGTRTLSPHALAHDGHRWHVRAYCHSRKAFRDFVVSRVLEARGVADAGPGAKTDLDWNTQVTLVLAPHPGLREAHRRAIEREYGMTRGRVELQCRKALLFYVLRHLRLDMESETAPEAIQIILKNRAQLNRQGALIRGASLKTA
jgi:predicted DNA-binding transcriptional regulator YafY